MGFFRSQDYEVGDRIVVRRKLVGTPGLVGDIIGHVVNVQPLVVRPQKVGGWPSDKEPIEVPDEQIVIVRRMPARTVRNADIRHLEHAAALAFPGHDHRWSADGSWLLRQGDSITERSNSAIPLGPAAGFAPVPLEEIRAFYDSHREPVILAIPERIGRVAQQLVDAHPDHWHLSEEILAMSTRLDLASPAGPTDRPAEPTDLPEGYRFEVLDEPTAEWLSLYHFRGTPLPADALRLLHSTIEGSLSFGTIFGPEGHVVAITRATLTESEDGKTWLGLSAVEVHAEHRGQGLGQAIVQRVMDWGRGRGATQAYLHVLASNTPAVSLYERCGFVEHHRIRYAHEISR